MTTQRRRVLVLLFLLLYGVYFVRTSVRFWNEGATDFPAYYYAAKAAFHEGSLPYDRSTLQKIAVREGRNADEVLPFLYPPPSLIIFSPFINLDYETARRLMLIINLVLVFVLLYLLGKILGEKPGSWLSFFALLYAAFFVPLTITISYGQINILVIVLICGAWYLAKEDRHPVWVALLLALATILKLYPILLLVPFWLRKQYKTVGFTLLFIAILVGITILVLPKGIWNSWYGNVGSVGYGVQVLGVRTTIPSNQSIYGFLARLLYGSNKRFSGLLLLPEQVAAFVPYIVIGLFLAMSLLISFISRNRSSFNLQMSFWLVISYLIAPISWHHHMVFVFPAILITLYELIYQKRDFKILIPVVLFALFWLYNYPSNLPAFRQGFNTLLMSVPLYIILIFWALLAFLLLRERHARQAQLT
jgi:alpha-1,2-mannosyltransferase